MTRTRYRYWCMVWFLSFHASSMATETSDQEDYTVQEICSSKSRFSKGIKSFFIRVMRDAAGINYNLLDWDTYKTFITIFPLYAIARISDGRLQNHFYDRKHHKNIHQLDTVCKGIAQKGFVFPVFFAGVLSIAAHDEDLRKTSRVFLLGFPFVMIISNIIKECDQASRSSLRPWNQFFSSYQRSYGGLPSGHMALATYAAMLYGIRFGPTYAAPLGAYAAFTAAAFLNCNRHYASQLIAGAGLGTVYALASSKWVDTKLATTLSSNVEIQAKVDAYGTSSVKFAYAF